MNQTRLDFITITYNKKTGMNIYLDRFKKIMKFSKIDAKET